MTLPDIRALLPHAGPMVLLDRVIEAADDTLCAEVRIHQDSMFYADGGVGSWVGVEYMAQAVAAHAGYLAHRKGNAVKPGFLLGSRRYGTTRPLFALGALLRVRVRQQLRGENGLAAFECSVEDAADGAELASAMLTVFQPDDVNEFLQGINKNE
ncbi:ApeP family dehydratase [Pseudoduganella namucuonensis]|uniref:Predicted 3-hydroxylacyl-ACP dehydratase, HotDog domain n=1 Tax=Pseudoduganella namucuonensis TaxID=1035707 RepID=A0A1I7IXE3_9BURK|nr:hotdog family protein [Pseudoduganella namucuonensis]SFU77615.1 Predicted 3-hydroxylacyl-ACP dehydratase, HotDog domain [Pseudoduganella namucuonensis]